MKNVTWLYINKLHKSDLKICNRLKVIDGDKPVGGIRCICVHYNNIMHIVHDIIKYIF